MFLNWHPNSTHVYVFCVDIVPLNSSQNVDCSLGHLRFYLFPSAENVLLVDTEPNFYFAWNRYYTDQKCVYFYPRNYRDFYFQEDFDSRPNRGRYY